MRAASLWALVMLSVRRQRRAALSSGFGVMVGVASLVFFVALGLGVGKVVREKVFPVDLSLIEVVPAQLNLGLLGGGVLDQAAVDRLAAVPGVERAYRKMNARVPTVSIYSGDFFGRPLRMGLEVIVVGVDPDFVEGDIKLGRFVDAPEGPIPAVASSRLIEIYNKTFAPARGLPQLGPDMLVGFKFPLDFNRSFVTSPPAGQVTSTQAQLVGVSPRGVLAGITVPLTTVQRLNRAAKVDAETFTAVTLKASEPAAVPSVVAQVKEMGLRVDDQDQRLAESTGAAVAITTLALAFLSVLICVLAAFNIGHALTAQVRTREKELGLFRAVGASKRDVRRLVQAEAALVGAVGGAVGTALAVGCAQLVDAVAQRALPEFPFKPQSYFDWPAWLVFLGLGLGLGAALLGALLPAAAASRIDPARTLAGQG